MPSEKEFIISQLNPKPDLMFSMEVHSANGKVKTFEAVIHRSGWLVTFIAQIFGFCPFSVSKNNRMIFRWLSLPAILVIVHVIGIISSVGSFLVFEDRTNKAFGVKNRAAVDQFGYSLWLFSTIGLQTTLRVLGILSREKTRRIWDRLHSDLQEIYENGTAESRAYFEEMLRRQAIKMRVLAFVISSMLVILVVKLIIPIFFLMLEVEELSFGIYTTFDVLIWNIHSIFSIAKTLWFVHVMDLIGTGFSVLLYEQIGERASGQQKSSRRSFQFFKYYEALEGLTQELGNKFCLELTITVVYWGVVVVSILYQVTGLLRLGSYGGYSLTVAELLLHISEIFLLCNSANRITMEVRELTHDFN
jgi:hypothetical protein